MRTVLALALIALPFIGCKPRIVYVPVDCPVPVELARPILPITAMKPEWTAEQREKALWESLALAIGYGKAQEAQLSVYRAKAVK